MIQWEYWLGPVTAAFVCWAVGRVGAVIVDVVWDRMSKKS